MKFKKNTEAWHLRSDSFWETLNTDSFSEKVIPGLLKKEEEVKAVRDAINTLSKFLLQAEEKGLLFY